MSVALTGPVLWAKPIQTVTLSELYEFNYLI